MFESALKPFGAYLTNLLARHNLSAATVSRMLGHKSRTTLRRILQDHANMESLIAPHILDRALSDGLMQTEFRSSPDVSEYILRQHEIHQQRFDNIYQKKRVTHIIIPYSSLRSFAQTGRMTDHFFGMRPFTVDERREILTHCRNQSRDNPYFNIYFTKDESIPLELEAACYEPVGVLLHGVGTNYNLAEEYAAALITLNDFTALFSQFFRDTLLSLYAHSVSASVTLLNSLIDELPKSE